MQFKTFMENLNEGAYEKSEENKRSADAAKKQGDMFAHHLHMADHHENLSQWHGEKGRHGEADKHAEKAEQHHEKAMALKEAVDREARSDYKLDQAGRKTHKQITFHDGVSTNDKEKEKPEMKEEMTDAQKAERERLVKGMKKSMAGFKAKYGERAKEVMYATATKKAMEEAKQEETPPFDGPYKKATGDGSVKDKSGAVHTPMSRARDLARQAMKKQMKEAKDEQEYGYEGDMALNQLATLTRCAEMIKEMLKPDTDMPEWVQSKITLATDYIQTAADYMYSEMNEELKGKQHKLDKNKNGKLDAHDFKLLRKEDAELTEGLDPSEIASNPKMYDASTAKKAYYHKSASASDKESLARHLDRHHGNKEWRKAVKEDAELEEAFINGREYATHGLMHPDHAASALHKVTGQHIDFYAHGTGDKVEGKVTKNDGKAVHIKDTKGTTHKFKVQRGLPKQQNEQAPVAPSLMKHRISVTVSDPDHTMVSKRKEKMQKTVVVTHSSNKEGAQKVGEKFYKKKGFIVHDSHHAGMVNEEVETIDELDKSTLASYVKKSSSKQFAAGHKAASADSGTEMKAINKAQKRSQGVAKAVDRLTRESADFDQEGNLMAEKLKFSDFIAKMNEQLLEYESDTGGVYRHTKKATYGTSYQGDDEDDKPKKPAPTGEKRGRGRPAGSKSGANQKVSSGKSYGGIAVHSLNLPK